MSRGSNRARHNNSPPPVFTSFPENGHTETEGDPKLLSNIYNRMRSITSAAANAILAKPGEDHGESPKIDTSSVSGKANQEYLAVPSPERAPIPISSKSSKSSRSQDSDTQGLGTSGSPLRYMHGNINPDHSNFLTPGQHKTSPSVAGVSTWDDNNRTLTVEESSATSTSGNQLSFELPTYLPPKLSRTASMNTAYSASYNVRDHLPGYAGDDDGSSDSDSIASTSREFLMDNVDTRIRPLRSGGLGKEFWMKDETASECFRCARPFSAFRRKHHCRLCGQIFCSSCTTLIPGAKFNYSGKMRICKNCLDVVDKYGSSSPSTLEFDDSMLDSPIVERPSQMPFEVVMDNAPPQPTPMMAIPATRQGESVEIFPSQNDITSSPKSTVTALRARRRGRAQTLDAGQRLSVQLFNDDEALATGTEDEAISDGVLNDDTDEEEDEQAMSLFAALNSSRVESDQVRNDQSTRSTFLRPRSGTSRSLDQGKASLMRIGTRRQTLYNGRRALLTRSKSSLHQKDSFPQPGSPVASPNIDLNKASIAHAHAFLSQLLENHRLSEKWHAALVDPLIACAKNIDLDIRGGDSIDIRHYVKFKQIPGGSFRDTSYIDGIVFTQSVVLKTMPREISNPRILLITFPIEYSRSGANFMSLDPIIAQEREYLKKLVRRIAALEPSLILAGDRISGVAVDLLSKLNIAVLCNVKQTVINRVSRYTQADIISSIDKLATQPNLGKCAKFKTVTYRWHDTAKTFIFLTGIPKELGCTILLRGADNETLSNVKAICEFMVYVIFNLKLETSLMRDQFVLVPSEPYRQHQKAILDTNGDSGYFRDLVKEQLHKIMSSSPFVQFGTPYLLQEARVLEDKLVARAKESEALTLANEENFLKHFDQMGLRLQISHIPGDAVTVGKLAESIDHEHTQRLHEAWSAQKRQWELSYAQFPDMFLPAAHQNIVVLFSVVCNDTATPCVGPDLVAVDYYSDNDMTIGQFIESNCVTSDESCPEECGRPLSGHYKTYVNGRGRVSVVVEKFQCPIAGMQETILMWSFCKECKNTMPVMPMSATTWKYSFGKYLELAFWSEKISFRAGICEHNLYRDHIRYFGYRDMAVRFEYESIDLLEIIVPGAHVQWSPEREVWQKLKLYNSIASKAKSYWESVEKRLNNVLIEGLDPEKVEECKMKVEELKARCEKEKKSVLSDLEETYLSTPVQELLPLNRILRDIQDLVAQWDTEFFNFEDNYLPSEKDITRITAQQLKKIFIDKADEPEMVETPSSEKDKSEGILTMPKDTETEKAMSEKDLPKTLDGDGTEPKEQTTEDKTNPVSDETAKKQEVQKPKSDLNQSVKPIPLPPAIPRIDETGTQRLSKNAESPADDNKVRPQESQSSTKDSVSGVGAQKDAITKQKSSEAEPKVKPGPPTKRPSYNKGGASTPVTEQRQSLKSTNNPSNSQGGALRKRVSDKISLPAQSLRQKFGTSTKELERQLFKNRVSAGQGKVSSLARQFDQLSREFEKKRARERSLIEQGRVKAFPVTRARPIVEVFKNAEDAVEEVSDAEDSDGILNDESNDHTDNGDKNLEPNENVEDGHREVEAPKEATTVEDSAVTNSLESSQNSVDLTPLAALKSPSEISIPQDRESVDHSTEKQTLMQILTRFWADRTAVGWSPLKYPLTPAEHIFADSDIIVREDEPSSLIAFCLKSPDYVDKLKNMCTNTNTADWNGEETAHSEPRTELESRMLKKTGIHLKYQFQEGSASFSCKIFYTEQFDAFRRQCHCDEKYIQSLSRCVKWDSSGGKSGSSFLKTLDDRLVVKQLSPTEFDAFMKFAPSYFEYMAQAFFHDLPTVLAKIFGLYQIQIRNSLTGKTIKLDIIVMENLFYNRKMTRVSAMAS